MERHSTAEHPLFKSFFAFAAVLFLVATALTLPCGGLVLRLLDFRGERGIHANLELQANRKMPWVLVASMVVCTPADRLLTRQPGLLRRQRLAGPRLRRGQGNLSEDQSCRDFSPAGNNLAVSRVL